VLTARDGGVEALSRLGVGVGALGD